MIKVIFTIILSTFTCYIQAETMTVVASEVDNLIPISGTVEAVDSATVSAQTSGKINTLNYDVNDIVEKGKVILTIDDTELQAKLAKVKGLLLAAIANNKRAESEYNRFKALGKQSYASADELAQKKNKVDVSQASIISTKAQLAEVTQQIKYTQVIAPYTGVMTARYVSIGESVSPGQPLIAGRSLNHNRAVLHVPVTMLDELNGVLTLSIESPNQDKIMLNEITVFPDVDPKTRTVTVWAPLSNTIKTVRPGSFIKVFITHGKKKRIYIPNSAVFQQGDLTLVYVLKDQKKVLRPIRISNHDTNKIEVLSGLNEGEQIMTEMSSVIGGHKK